MHADGRAYWERCDSVNRFVNAAASKLGLQFRWVRIDIEILLHSTTCLMQMTCWAPRIMQELISSSNRDGLFTSQSRPKVLHDYYWYLGGSANQAKYL